MRKKCTDCDYAVEKSYGYSNYTVEGIDVFCLHGLNPDFPVDRFYGEEKTLLFAEACPSFKEGEPIGVDVESYGVLPEEYCNDPEIFDLFKKLWDDQAWGD